MRPGLVPILFGGGYSPVKALGSDLIAYWDAARPDTMTLSASNAVSSWRDIKAGYDATQGTGAAQPIWSPTSFNGYHGVAFDGTDDELTSTDAALLATLPVGSSPSELWVLVSQDALPADTTVRRGFGYGGSNEATARIIARSVSGGVNRARCTIGHDGTATSVTANAVDLSSRHVIRWSIGAAAQTLFVDGVSVGTAAVTPASQADRLRIGSLPSSSPGFYWQGRFAVAMVTRQLDAFKAVGLLAYLMSRRRV